MHPGTYFAMSVVIISLFAGSIVMLIGSVLLYTKSKQYMKQTKDKVKKITEYTKNSNNKIGTLPIQELSQYLTQVFSLSIEIALAKDISDKDPNNAVVLYSKALERMLIYLGSDTIRAIEFYYGKGFVIRWCEANYMHLENTGHLATLMAKQIRSV